MAALTIIETMAGDAAVVGGRPDSAAPGLAWCRTDRMRTLAGQAAADLAAAPAEEVIRWAADAFGERICATSSMTDAVIIQLASAVQPGIDVLFLYTGYHLAETIGTRNTVEADFITQQGVLVNPLVYDGYPSIGCATCTIRAEVGADPRSGRWAGTGKTECGIHA
jgi:3'-phosphoadenosine 5'-phosphosulfate sulfotransferase (PAPS reductase)/FAD synthetase